VEAHSQHSDTWIPGCLKERSQSALLVPWPPHLSQSDHEEVVGVFGVVLGQLPQHGGQAGVVGA